MLVGSGLCAVWRFGCWFAIALDIKLGTKIPKRRSQREDEGEMEAQELKLKAGFVI